MPNELTKEQIERLVDNIGDSDYCSDDDCSCHYVASLSRMILDGEENYEVLDEL